MSRYLTLALIVVGLAGLGLTLFATLHQTPPAATPVAAAAPAPPPPPVNRTVLVAAGPLRAGALLKPADITSKTLLATDVAADAVDNSPQATGALFGAMVRKSLGAGEPITEAGVMRPGDHGFLAAVLQPGMRAMTLGPDVINSQVDLVWPGDHVDLVLTQQIDANKAVANSKRIFGNTVLSNVRVLAVDQQLVEGAAADQATPKPPRTVTIELAPDQTGRLAVAERIGKLAFAIHSAEQAVGEVLPAATEPPDTIWAGDVAPGLASETPTAPRKTIRVWQGAADAKELQF